MKILIDNGHGFETKGKRSPDGRLMEWSYTREIANDIVSQLNKLGYDAERIVMEEKDVSLGDRCKRVNSVCNEYGQRNVLLVSIHVNASGSDGKWHDARGFTAHVSNNASLKSKMFAKHLWEQAINNGLKGNRFVPSCMYIPQNLAICRDTKCAAVLTENLFMDNVQDVEFLLSKQGKEAIVKTHIDAIVKMIVNV